MPPILLDLVLDVGNTRVKWGLFNAQGIVKHGVAAHGDVSGLMTGVGKEGISGVVLGSTSHPDPTLLAALGGVAPVLEITGSSDAPIGNGYGSRPTLGADRLANATAAVQRFPGRPCLVIDLGTCVTYDVCEPDGTYAGGAISPGLLMRARAMNAYSARLPLVEPGPAPALLGTTTQQGLEAGVHFGLLGELEGFIRRFGHRRPNMAVLLTGGDAPRIARGLESGIFALPLLTLEGYHALLTHHRTLHGGGIPPGSGAGTRSGAAG